MPDIVNPETHHERSDVNVRALLGFVAIFILFAALSHLGLWLMFRQFVKMFRHRQSAPLTALARPADAAIPQQPRLQPFPNRDPRGAMMPPSHTTPVVDMEEMRATEEQTLHSPGWVDKQKGIVRVPIDVAKQLAVQRISGQRAAGGGQGGAQ